MLTDPTGGIGYLNGEVLPSADMTTIATQQPNALDVVNGGNYDNEANIVINNGGTVKLLGLAGMKLYLYQDTVLVAAAPILYGTPRQVIKRCHSPASLVCEISDTVAGFGDWSYAGIDNSGGSGLVAGTHCRLDYVNVGASAGATISFDLTPILDPGEIVSASVYIDPAGSSADPVHLPKLQLIKINQFGAETVLDTVTDPGGGAFIYRIQHILTLTLGTPYDYNPATTGETLILRFHAEQGNNATLGLLLHSLQVTENISQLDHY